MKTNYIDIKIDERLTKGVYLYPKKVENLDFFVLYKDKECTVGVTKEELKEFFFLGAVIVFEEAPGYSYLTPFMCEYYEINSENVYTTVYALVSASDIDGFASIEILKQLEGSDEGEGSDELEFDTPLTPFVNGDVVSSIRFSLNMPSTELDNFLESLPWRDDAAAESDGEVITLVESENDTASIVALRMVKDGNTAYLMIAGGDEDIVYNYDEAGITGLSFCWNKEKVGEDGVYTASTPDTVTNVANFRVAEKFVIRSSIEASSKMWQSQKNPGDTGSTSASQTYAPAEPGQYFIIETYSDDGTTPNTPVLAEITKVGEHPSIPNHWEMPYTVKSFITGELPVKDYSGGLSDEIIIAGTHSFANQSQKNLGDGFVLTLKDVSSYQPGEYLIIRDYSDNGTTPNTPVLVEINSVDGHPSLDDRYNVNCIVRCFITGEGPNWNGYVAGVESYGEIEEPDNGEGETTTSLTAFEVGDVVTTIKFDTSKETELVSFLTDLFAANPDEDQINLVSYDLASTTEISPDGPILAAGNLGDGVYALITANGDTVVTIYSTGEFDMDGVTGVKGWQNLNDSNTFTFTFSEEDLTVSELHSEAGNVNGIVFGK